MDNQTKIKLKWLNDNFGLDKLRRFKHDDCPDSIFYKKGKRFVFEQDLKNKNFWVSHNEVWSIFESFFVMEYDEIKSLIKAWLEETEKLGEYTPVKPTINRMLWLENTEKLEEYTPIDLKEFEEELWDFEENEKMREYIPKL